MKTNLPKRYSIAMDGDELGLVTNLVQMIYLHKSGQYSASKHLAMAVELLTKDMGPVAVGILVERLSTLALCAGQDGEIGVIIHESPVEQ